MKTTVRIILALALLAALDITTSVAAVMNDYCIVPPFIQEIAKPNLLMIIDNSASMYDLAYDDKGYKYCSSTTSQACSVNTDCPSGETCTSVRNPTYCYDETFSSASSYVGSFDPAKNYKYDFTAQRFQEETGSIPTSCAMASETGIFCKQIAGSLHLNIDTTVPTRSKYFYASGKFLNWLVASKFDVEKDVLTGGKYVTKVCSNNNDKACLVDTDCCPNQTSCGNTCNSVSAFIQPESRGCVGMGYIKNVDTANFLNYATGTTNPNTPLALTFLVKGPQNLFNPVSPSTGGQTYLEIYSKLGATYDYEACQKAITAIATGTNAEVKQNVDNCLSSSGTALGYCQQNSSLLCAASYGPLTPNCDKPAVSPNPHCSTAPTRSCTTATEDVDCKILGAKTCTTGTIGVVCASNTDCDVKTCSSNSATTCSADTDCVKATETLGSCSQKQQTACRADSDCISGGGNINNGPCVGYVPAYNYGTCNVSTTGSCTPTGDLYTGPCVSTPSGYLGPCVFPTQSAGTKTKVSFSASMQACWSYRQGTPIGTDEIQSVKNQCSDIYGSYATCSNTGSLCDPSVANGCGAGNTCLTGPPAIQAGNPAILCSSTYEGQLFQKNSSGAWVLRTTLPAILPGACLATDSVDNCVKNIHTQFCDSLDAPLVNDPTNPPSSISTTETLPAILTGISVEAQLGLPIITLPVRVETSAPPAGLVQEYANKIRLGLMSFNDYGSASETSTLIPTPANKLKATRVCSNDDTMVCTQNSDCGPDNSCNLASDRDGAKVISLVGKGRCSTPKTTVCTSDANCSSGDICSGNLCWTPSTTVCTKAAHCSSGDSCISDGVGTHTTAGLVSSIGNLRAGTWTPFAEAYYNAIGYFAIDPSDTTGKSSRTGLRLNATDFPSDMNPSEYVCQPNNILLVTDGSSTADQSSSVTGLVDVYKGVSGNVTGPCTIYAGSQNLDDLSWIARHRNINIFSTSTASTDLPQKKNQSITSYVVFNGSDNGEAGDCNNTTLLNKTARNGGTALMKTEIPEQYQETLRRAFEQVAGGTASGTAASILSNSEGSGANILQAVFYPSKEFETETVSGVTTTTSASWIGEMQNLWYYVDPYIGNSTVRENTADAATVMDLNVKNDYVAEFQFKGGETIAVLKKDDDGNGSGDSIVTNAMDPRVTNQGYCTNTAAPASSTYAKCEDDAGCSGETCIVQGVVDADKIKSLWRAGKQLWNRDPSTRTLYTYLYGSTASACGASTFSVPGLFELTASNWSTLGATDKCIIKAFLNIDNPLTALDSDALNIIKFAQGYDHVDYDSTTGAITGTIDGNKPRSRSVKIDGTKKVWKLGDIITSTPRIQSFNKLNNFHLDSPAGYEDMTYADDTTGTGFANSPAYKTRGMAYAGANDGMLHAFSLGSLNITASGDIKAKMTGTGLGEEQWAFIPKNVLPYLKYLADPAYSHLYLVDGPTRLIDASIGYNDNNYINDAALRSKYTAAGCDGTGGTSSHSAYWACKRDSTTDVTDPYDPTANKSWRSIIIGSMGIGGASAEFGATCTNCVRNPVEGAGRSSYYALDITDPENPKYLWEFTDDDLGYATTGAAVARIGHKFTDSGGNNYKNTNGRWFAVIGNGPTGPIDTTYHQFKGKSDKPLRVFVLDLKDGTLLKKIDTTIGNAFAGSMASAPIDTDRSKKLSDGFYSDDALYFGYSACTANCDADTPTWNGGIMRLLTDEKIYPVDPVTGIDNWSLSPLISNIGPVTTAIGKLQDRKYHNLWLYTGSGRYFFKGDDSSNAGKIIGIKEPCYSPVKDDLFTISEITGQSPRCTDEITFAAGELADQTSAINTMIDKKGWFLDLEPEDTVGHFGAERIITEPVAMPNGAVFFTSFMPSSDTCNYGGKSFLWGMRYDTGGTASASQLKGKALVQVSTGAFEEVNLATALTSDLGRKMETPMIGKPPTDPPPIVSGSGNKPLKRILHIQEK